MSRKIILFVIIIAVILGGYFGISWYLKNKAASSQTAVQTDNGFEVTSPSGSVKLEYLADPASVNYGLAIYPGAEADADKEISATTTINGTTITYGTFDTSDSTEKVVAYYQKQMGSSSKVNIIQDGDSTVKLVSIQDKNTPVVRVYSENATTKFTLIK
jgi:hypothetical protein